MKLNNNNDDKREKLDRIQLLFLTVRPKLITQLLFCSHNTFLSNNLQTTSQGTSRKNGKKSIMNIVTMIQQSILLSAHYVHLHKKQRDMANLLHTFSVPFVSTGQKIK